MATAPANKRLEGKKAREEEMRREKKRPPGVTASFVGFQAVFFFFPQTGNYRHDDVIKRGSVKSGV